MAGTSPLFSKLGREHACGSKITLLCASGKAEGELHSEGFLLSLNPNTIFVSTRASVRELASAGADLDRLSWLDATGKLFWKDAPEKSKPNLSFVEGPQALSHISMLLASMSASGNYSFVVFNCANCIADKNGEEKALKFFEFLAKKFRSLRIGALFVLVGDGACKSSFKKGLAQLCDKSVSA